MPCLKLEMNRDRRQEPQPGGLGMAASPECHRGSSAVSTHSDTHLNAKVHLGRTPWVGTWGASPAWGGGRAEGRRWTGVAARPGLEGAFLGVKVPARRLPVNWLGPDEGGAGFEPGREWLGPGTGLLESGGEGVEPADLVAATSCYC